MVLIYSFAQDIFRACMKITIRNVKRVAKLAFDMPSQGVWVLTGLNGSGKTSLFAAINRIGNRNSFQRFYKTSPLDDKLDSYSEAEIEYQIGDSVVTYRYGGQRWRASPRRNSGLFNQSPYASIGYIEASGDRIEPFPDEIQTKKLRDAKSEVKKFLSFVLDDRKWDKLKYVNTRRGIGSDAYLIPYQVANRNYYYSEKSFSLGELCSLKLAIKITGAPPNSLLLIDEVEMALHPQAQVRLLKKVVQIAKEKNLTVLFSTHSATIIKNSNRKQIIHLRSDNDGNILPVVGAFPAQVLGDIAFDDELAADFVFYVEDKQAKLLAEQLVSMYMAHCHPDGRYQPLYKVAPVGGFVQVVEMLNNSSTIFASYVKRFAFLDEDVKTETLALAKKQKNRIILDLFKSASNQVKFLPCTPELGVIKMIEDQSATNTDLFNSLCSMFQGHNINIRNIIQEPEYLQLSKENLRDRAKDRMTYIVNKIMSAIGADEIYVRRTIYNEYCKFKYERSIGQLRELLGPVFNSR